MALPMASGMLRSSPAPSPSPKARIMGVRRFASAASKKPIHSPQITTKDLTGLALEHPVVPGSKTIPQYPSIPYGYVPETAILVCHLFSLGPINNRYA